MYRGTTSAGYGNPGLITDGDPATRWLSNTNTTFPAAQWAYVDLGASKSVDSVQIVWGVPYATSFQVQTWASSSQPYQAMGSTWQTTSAGTIVGAGGSQTVTFTPVKARYVRVLLTASSDGAGGAYSIAELTVFAGTTQLTTNAATTSQSSVAVSSTDLANKAGTTAPFDFESFMTYLQSFKPAADAMITVNFGTGTPQEAAAWVHYANVVKGYGIHYWQVGNELEGNWETGGPLNAADYVKRYVEFYDAMKAEDPTILVLGPVSGGIGEPSNLGDGKTFIQDFIEILNANGKADHIDGIDFHWYPNWESVSDDVGVATVSQLGAFATNLKSWLAATSAKPNVPVFLTEYNMGIGSAYTPVYDNQLVGGLWVATAFGEYIRYFGNGGGTFLWNIISTGDTVDSSNPAAGDLGYLQSTNNAYVYQEHADYWTTQMMSSNWAIAGDTRAHQLVATTSSQSALSAYADLRPDGALTLAVINSDATNAYGTSIRLGSFVPGSAADVWTFDARNYVWETSAAPYHAEPDLPPTHHLACGAATTTPFTFAPSSVTVIRFAPPGAPTAVLPDAGTGNEADGGTSYNYVLIDDMESTTSGPISLSMASTGLTAGGWYDVISTGSTSNTISPDPFAFSALSAPHETMTGVTSSKAAHIACTMADQYGYCQVGFGFADPPTAFDISKFTGIVFWGMSSAANSVKVQIANDDSDPAGGKCGMTDASTARCWDSYATYLSFTDKWQKFEVKFSKLRQDGWGMEVPTFDATTARGINFLVQGPTSTTAPAINADFWIDDVYFE
jgi:hypothetical protein